MPEFIIWNPKGTTPPSVIFDSREDAEAEARRLANKQRGEFYVCALISISVTPDAVTTSLEAPAQVEAVSPETLLPSFEGGSPVEVVAPAVAAAGATQAMVTVIHGNTTPAEREAINRQFLGSEVAPSVAHADQDALLQETASESPSERRRSS